MRTAITRRRPRTHGPTYQLPASLNVVRPPRRAVAVPIPRQRVLQGRVFRQPPTRSHVDGPDALRFYLSGAASDGGAQTSFADSLGGYRSSTEADRVGRLILSLPTSIDVLQASRANGVGAAGSIMTVGPDRVRYAAPGGSAGPAQTISNGQTRTLVDGADSSKWIRVERTSAAAIAGAGVVEFAPQRNNLFGFADADDAEHTAGSSRYRGLYVLARHAVAALKFWVKPLAASAVSSAAQLGGAGAGSVGFAADAVASWPRRGWAAIFDGGSLREIVFYSSRTLATLTVPAYGRSRLGSSAAAGANTDVVYPVPPIAIAWEAAVAGAIQTIADDETEPTGLSWSTGISAATGVAVGDLAAGAGGGLWIWRELPAGVEADAHYAVQIGSSFSSQGIAYGETLEGLFRIADATLDRFELRLGTDAPPALSDAPVETSASLPITHAGLVAGHDYYACLDRRNQWNVLAQSLQPTIVRMTADGSVRQAPRGPYQVLWSAGAGGVFELEAYYAVYQDATVNDQGIYPNANQWLVYVRYDGTDPDPDLDTPTVVEMALVDELERLVWTSPAKTAGVVGKVLVRTRRAATGIDPVDSANVDVYSATAATAGPADAELQVFQRLHAELL